MRLTRSLLPVCFLLSLLTLFLPRPAQAFGPNAFLESYSPTEVTAGTQAEVRVRIRTTIGSYRYLLRVEGVNQGGWVITPQISDWTGFISNNRTHDFALNLTTPDLNQTGEIEVTLFGENDFGDVVEVFNQTISVTARRIPQPFSIAQPGMGAEVEGAFNVTWNPSQYADDYVVTVRRRHMGAPQEPPVFQTVTDANTTIVSLNTEQLDMIKGQQYQVDILARNSAGTRANSNEPFLFTVKPPPDVGDFTITSPTKDEEVGGTPSFSWTPAPNVVSYSLSILREVDGLPSLDDPILVREDLEGTSLQWEGPPLDPGFYYVSMRAFGEDANDVLFNEGGPIRFEVVRLSGDFRLLSPSDGRSNVEPGLVEFTWETLPGTESYVFELWEKTGPGDFRQWVKSTIAHVPGLPFLSYTPSYRLIAGRTYMFGVVARSGPEERAPEVAGHEFQTTPLTPFNLVSPIGGDPNVPRRPHFKWNPTGGDNTVYFLQFAPMNNDGKPRLSELKTSPSLTETEYTHNEDLVVGGRYLWRVVAEMPGTDPVQRLYNQGQWQPFQVNPLRDFILLGPSDGSTQTTPNPTLAWQPVSAAEGYRVYLIVERTVNDPGEGERQEWVNLPVMNVPAGTNMITPAEYGVRLNSEQDYFWSVEAYAGKASKLASNGPWSFISGRQQEVTTCDLVDHLLGRQKFTMFDMLLAGISAAPFDISYYRMYLMDPSQTPCDPRDDGGNDGNGE